MYAELIGNYKKYRIKSLYDNIFEDLVKLLRVLELDYTLRPEDLQLCMLLIQISM